MCVWMDGWDGNGDSHPPPLPLGFWVPNIEKEGICIQSSGYSLYLSINIMYVNKDLFQPPYCPVSSVLMA